MGPAVALQLSFVFSCSNLLLCLLMLCVCVFYPILSYQIGGSCDWGLIACVIMLMGEVIGHIALIGLQHGNLEPGLLECDLDVAPAIC